MHSAVLFGHKSPAQNKVANVPLSTNVRNQMFDLYHQRVDCLYKMLHWPTTLSHLERLQTTKLGAKEKSDLIALETAICFMAVRSITDREAIEFRFGDRSALTCQLCEATEQAISAADLLQHPSVIVLQSFVIYLVRLHLTNLNFFNKKVQIALRTCNNTAASWTLLAIAIRTGSSIRLGQEDEKLFDPLELQIRRRLWYSIAMLDTFSSLDRGSPAMLSLQDLGPPPLMLNDESLSSTCLAPSSTPDFTNMSCFELMTEAMRCNKKILSLPNDPDRGWSAKLQVVADFCDRVKRDYMNVGPDASLLQRFASNVAAGLIPSMQMIIRRPPYKQFTTAVPSSDHFDVLECSTSVLRHELEIKSPEFAPWAWKTWVQWYLLAVLLAELCNEPPGERYETSYAIAVRIFDKYSTLVADSDTGKLWIPIARLMRRVHRQRQRHIKHTAEDSPSEQTALQALSIDVDAPAFDASVPWTADLDVLSYPRIKPSVDLVNGPGQHTLVDDSSPFDWSMFVDEVALQYASTTDEDILFGVQSYGNNGTISYGRP
jgi:hypothetical protein